MKQWLRDFEEQADIFNWNDLQKHVYARRLMAGSAKLYVSNELKSKNWNQLKAGIIEEFTIKVNSTLIHKKLAETKKKKDKKFREYCYRMIDIASPANIDTTAVITYIVDGISDTTANKMICIRQKQ